MYCHTTMIFIKLQPIKQFKRIQFIMNNEISVFKKSDRNWVILSWGFQKAKFKALDMWSHLRLRVSFYVHWLNTEFWFWQSYNWFLNIIKDICDCMPFDFQKPYYESQITMFSCFIDFLKYFLTSKISFKLFIWLFLPRFWNLD